MLNSGQVNGIEITKLQDTPFYKESDRSFGAFLVNAIYPVYIHAEDATKEYDLKISQEIGEDSDYHILCFGGNERQAQLCVGIGVDNTVSTESKVQIHTIEMPGIGESKGLIQNHSHCIKAAIMQVEYLIAQGVDPEKIILYGMSLGGAISTIAGAHLHAQGKKVSVFNDRSFSTLSAVVNGMVISRIFGYVVAPLILLDNLYHGSLFSSTILQTSGKALVAYALANSVVKIVLRATNWEMNAGNAYLSIPQYYKRLSYAVNDCVITNLGGLFKVTRNAAEANRVHSYTTKDPFNHGAFLNFMTREENIDMQQDFIFFIKEVQVRNAIKDYVVAYYNSLDSLENANDFNINKIEIPNALKANERLEQAFLNGLAEARELINQYKIEQQRTNKQKRLISGYQNLRSACRNVVSLFYNLHEGIGLDNHLYMAQALADKIIDNTVAKIMDTLDRDTIAEYQYQNSDVNRIENIKKFTKKIGSDVEIEDNRMNR